MTRRLLCALTLLVLAACATPTRTAQPTPTTPLPASSSTVAASTTTIAQASAVTGTGGPDSFTTLRPPGDVQVLVTRVACAGGPGDGWRVTYRISNQGEPRVGAVLAKVDEDGAEAVLVPALSLRAGQSFEATQVIKAAGDSVRVTWANADRPVRSFPMEAPTCLGTP
jgi:ABC-type transport system substrate-binding protein